jgi:hypothetical protein
MKTIANLTSIILITLAVSFPFLSSKASVSNTGDNEKAATIKNISNDAENELNYLRFDVSKFIGFNDSETNELPVETEFDYLRFDVNAYSADTDDMTELPANEFNYLRFDVNTFYKAEVAETTELPVAESNVAQ